VYGHPGHGIAYVVPAKHISQDIEKRFGSPISLALTGPATSEYPKPRDTLEPQVIQGNAAPALGISLADIATVVDFCMDAYLKCSDAGGEYSEISRVILSLHIILGRLEFEVEASSSSSNSDRSIWGRRVAPIVGDADSTLRQLDRLLQFRSEVNAKSQWSLEEKLAKRRSDADKMAQLEAIRVTIISCSTSLALLADTIQLYRSGKIPKISDSSNAIQLGNILDKVDLIVSRMGQKNSQNSADDKEVWKQFRKELVAEGFSARIPAQHKVSQLPASNIQGTNAYIV
jgi:hypothetical protein